MGSGCSLMAARWQVFFLPEFPQGSPAHCPFVRGVGPGRGLSAGGGGGQALEGLSYLPKVRKVRGACANGCLNDNSLEPLTLAFTLLMLRDSGPQPGRSQPS